MKTVKRFVAILLASFFMATLGGSGLITPRPGWAEAPVPGSAQSPEAGLENSLPEDWLQIEPASRPEESLPTPYPISPDGTLQLPSPEPAASEPEQAETPAIVYQDESPTATDLEALLSGLDPQTAKRSQLLIEADRLYLAGDIAAAEVIYRRVKDSKWLAEATLNEPIVPITDPEELPPAGRVYWREALAGAASEFPNRVLVPLGLLVKDYPEFLPAQGMYARYLVQQDRASEALQVLEEAVARFPYYPDLLKAQTEVLMAQEKWIEAAITANQFALLNPDHPEAAAMAQLAQDNLARFRGQMNQTLTSNLIANIITGAAGYLLTGGILGPYAALNSGLLLLQGESGLGAQMAEQVKRQLPMVDDPEIRAYVNNIGQTLAALTGRQDFNFTFEVIMDDSLNAFALPGGKIFINAGAITKSASEAELAGLLSHEISHAVLSHGFQMATQGNLMASLAAFIPIPEVAGIAANLIVASYSRDMERQADILGTKILANGNYAADGLHNLMVTLKQEYGGAGVSWFASHPNPEVRISYLKQLVDQGRLNRYAYEGVEPHLKISQKMNQLLTQYKLQQGTNNSSSTRGRPQWR